MINDIRFKGKRSVNWDDVEMYLRNYVGDYYKGPKQDYDPNRPGDIWEFKKNIDGIQFYVKVKIIQENGKDILKCIGFHEDDFA